MKIIIRADASIYIGSGHVMRCLVLANALSNKGHQIEFAIRPQPSDLVAFIRSKGFTVHELMQPQKWQIPEHMTDYAAWLQVPWEKDVQDFLSYVERSDLVIIDHYGIGQEWERIVKNQLGCGVFVIDDLVRSHSADLLLDQTLLRQADKYEPLCPRATILTGCDYALLSPQFTDYREQALDQAANIEKRKVLISMGGIDLPNATLSVLETFSKQKERLRPQVTVLLGERAPHYLSVKLFCEQNSSWVTHIGFVDNMAKLMLEHFVAVGAPGTTSWERACLGIPSVIIPLADNQKTISSSLVLSAAAISIELEEIPDKLLTAYQTLLDQWSRYRETNLSLCDGLGCQRVVRQIEIQFNQKSGRRLSARKATLKDVSRVYKWQCEPATRRYAINAETPVWSEHKTWMEMKLSSGQGFFYILVWSGLVTSRIDVGVVRLDRISNARYVISIFIDPQHHGKGIAGEALELIDEIHSSITIEAAVLTENTASQKLFESAGYHRVREDFFIRKPITRDDYETIYNN